MDKKTALSLAEALVGRMTLEEQASQLRYDAPAIPRLGIPAYNWWNEALHGVARAGTATMFPQAIGLAATFDAPLLGEVARTTAVEARAKYNAASGEGDRDIYKGLTFFSPNINIFRDPRWGRGHETYGEDPHLTSRLGVAFIKGLQGDDEHPRAAACAKHFAVHSGPESTRHEFDAEVSAKDLRETYLPAFEAAVREADVRSVMGAYNRLLGEPCCGSKLLLEDILRREWGFDGFVVSDCWAIADFHMRHHITDTAPESAALAIRHGCDLNCGNTYLNLLIAVKEGLATEAQIGLACTRLMAERYRLGLLGVEKSEYDSLTLADCDTDENAALALKAARESLVLLKNDGALPLSLDELKTIAVIGPNADSRACLEGNYAGTSSREVTFLEGIRAACAGKARVLYARGCDLVKNASESLALDGDRLAEAVAAAKMADAVVLCLGLDTSLEGEQGDQGNARLSGDKPDLELPASQRKLLAALLPLGKKLITVVAAGSALRVEDGDAILYSWYPGQAGGTALAEALFGAISPSGRLPVTFYRSADELPDFSDYSMKGRTYRYFEGEPLYPFGYGLSYADFEYSDASYGAGAISVTIENIGAMPAREVAQAYVRVEHPDSPPHASLCAFASVVLAPGEKRRVTLELSKQAFTVVAENGERLLCSGKKTLYVGGGGPDARTVALTGRRSLALEL